MGNIHDKLCIVVGDDEADKVVEEVAAKPSTNLVSLLHSDLKNFTHDRGQ